MANRDFFGVFCLFVISFSAFDISDHFQIIKQIKFFLRDLST